MNFRRDWQTWKFTRICMQIFEWGWMPLFSKCDLRNTFHMSIGFFFIHEWKFFISSMKFFKISLHVRHLFNWIEVFFPWIGSNASINQLIDWNSCYIYRCTTASKSSVMKWYFLKLNLLINFFTDERTPRCWCDVDFVSSFDPFELRNVRLMMSWQNFNLC